MNKYLIFFIIMVILIITCKRQENFTIDENYGINRFTLILYINLEHRNDRNDMILKQLKKVKADMNNVQRIDAIKHQTGAIGCCKSHILSLQTALDNNVEYAIILEDDFTWKHGSKKTNKVLENIYKEMSKNDYPVCLLACNGSVKNNGNKYISNVLDCGTTSGYIIRKNYIKKLKDFWEEKMENCIKKGWNTPICALDVTWKELQKRDNWISSNPILGYQAPSYSDIQKGNVDYGV